MHSGVSYKYSWIGCSGALNSAIRFMSTPRSVDRFLIRIGEGKWALVGWTGVSFQPAPYRKMWDWKSIILCVGRTLTLQIGNASLGFCMMAVFFFLNDIFIFSFAGDGVEHGHPRIVPGMLPRDAFRAEGKCWQEFSWRLTGHDTNRYRKEHAIVCTKRYHKGYLCRNE